MSRRIMLLFEHPTCDVSIDVYLPVPDPIEVGAEVMADHCRPACPICKMALQYVGFCLEDAAEKTPARAHVPRIAWTPVPRIVSCACGWLPPPGTPDSDTAFSWHCAIEKLKHVDAVDKEET